jgi:mono/diheme cytochrome c family protein
MRYFFLIYAIIAIAFVGIFGIRGTKFTEPPIRLFPDMDDQDVTKAQKTEAFFADGVSSRQPVANTAPIGFHPQGETKLGGIAEYEFSGAQGYYDSGHFGDYYGSGMPTELQLDEKSAVQLLKRGHERFDVYCSVCHGKSGNGAGITSNYGVPGIANLTIDNYGQAAYPDGRLFEVITKGKGNMSGYGYNIPIRDRWAIVAYIRAMQIARRAPYDAVKEAYDAGVKASSTSTPKP